MMHLKRNDDWTECGVPVKGFSYEEMVSEGRLSTDDLEGVTCLVCLRIRAKKVGWDLLKGVEDCPREPLQPMAVLPRARYFMPSVLVLYYPPGSEEEADRILGLLKAGEPVRLPSDRYPALEGGEKRWRLEVVGGGELGGQEVKTQKTPLFPYAVCPKCGTATNDAYTDGVSHLCYCCKNVFP